MKTKASPLIRPMTSNKGIGILEEIKSPERIMTERESNGDIFEAEL